MECELVVDATINHSTDYSSNGNCKVGAVKFLHGGKDERIEQNARTKICYGSSKACHSRTHERERYVVAVDYFMNQIFGFHLFLSGNSGFHPLPLQNILDVASSH